MTRLCLLALAVLLSGCVCPPWVCEWDEDGFRDPDDRRDDDDRADDDDREDDDDAADDDDASGDVLDALNFAITFDAVPRAAGDDDDSADDDDSGAGGPEVTDLVGTLVTRYWSDYDSRELLCEQHVAFDGEARFEGAPDCEGCTGFVQLRASSIEDVSNPVVDPDHCDPSEASARGLDFGRRLLTPAGVGGLGDFLSIALVDAETGLAAGLEFAPTDGLSYAEQDEALAEDGAELTHGGYLRSTPDGLVEGAGIDQAAGTPDGASQWFGFWRVFRTLSVNPYEGTDLQGRYAAQSVWVVFPR